VEPLWTEPGWNLHTPQEMKIDAFQAKRAPVGAIRPNGTVDLSEGSYKTMQLAGIFVRENGIHMQPANKGRYYHDGRFATLLDVVKSYNKRFNLGLTSGEMSDLVEYLKSLIANGSAEVGG
jgi:cytochrome c peroxidase